MDNDNFGWSVSIDGNRALIGARKGQFANSPGAGYLFERDTGGNWSETAQIGGSRPVDGVALNGGVAVLGNVFSGRRGTAEVYEELTSGSWTRVDTITATDTVTSDRGEDLFGEDVAVFGDTIIGGAARDAHAGNFAGSAHTFVRQASGNWEKETRLVASDPSRNDVFGRALDYDGQTIAVGANGFVNDGATFLYRELNAGEWSQVAKLVSPIPGVSNFGEDVAVFGNRALVGTLGDGAFLFEESRGGNWEFIAQLLPGQGVSPFGFFGEYVALNEKYAVATERTRNGGSVFVYNIAGLAEQPLEFAPSDVMLGDEFGGSVSLWNDQLLVGAWNDSDPESGSETGCVRIDAFDSP